MKIAVIGAGYVGLVTASVFADLGNEVFCVDISEEKINSLKDSKIPFFEPGLADLVKRNIKEGRLLFTTKYEEAVPQAEVVFICVGTPPKTNGEADLSYVEPAIMETAKNISKQTLVVVKSTVPVGAEEDFIKVISDDKKDLIEFASCPEFLREGSALEDSLHPDRIVIGVTSKNARNLLSGLYAPLKSRILVTDLWSAQMIKYVSNTFLATKISFSNMVANLCEKVGADIEDVLEGAGLDKRITRTFFYPGVGYGGSCFPKDVKAFISIFRDEGIEPKLLEAVEEINKDQIDLFVEKAQNLLGDVEGKVIAILGLSFKPNTDDLREAPSLKIIRKLLEMGAKIKAFDPEALENARKTFSHPDLEYVHEAYDSLKDADLMVLVTEWNEFKELDLNKVKELMREPNLLDGRNIYDPQKVKTLGFKYQGIGRS